MLRKIINDPVHGFIHFDDPLILAIINHPFVQRLRGIKQMALAYLVYPGAVHTRFLHSIGAYHLMCNAIIVLKQKGIEITPAEEQAVKIAILLHDVGHGPFSHSLEHSLVDVSHEELSLLIMERLNDEMNGALSLAICIFKNQYHKHFLHQLVSSQLDMDRLDYLARDSFFTGVSEGVIGHNRLIAMLHVWNDNLVIEEKGLHSVEHFLTARRYMYWQVYLHKTVLSSEVLLMHILQRAQLLFSQKKKLFTTPSLHFFLNKKINKNDFNLHTDLLNQYTQLDDSDIITSIKIWATCEDKILSELCTRLLKRNLFKIKFVKNDEEIELLRKEQNKNENENSRFFIIDEVQHLGYDNKNNRINILYKNGTLKNIFEISGSLLHADFSIPVIKKYVCYST